MAGIAKVCQAASPESLSTDGESACHVEDNGWFDDVPIFILKKTVISSLGFAIVPYVGYHVFFANTTGQLFCLGLLAPPFGAIFAASGDRWVKGVAWLEFLVVLALQGRARFATTAFTVRQGGHPWKMLAFIVLTCMIKWAFINIAFLETYQPYNLRFIIWLMVFGQLISTTATRHSCISILNPLQHLLYLLPTGTVAGTKSRNSARTNSFCGWSQWRQVLWPGPFLRIASWAGWKVRLLDIQLGQDSAEETLKLVERVAQHSPEQSWLEFGDGADWCGVETGEPWNSKPCWMMSWLAGVVYIIFSGGEAEYGNDDGNRFWQNTRFCGINQHFAHVNVDAYPLNQILRW